MRQARDRDFIETIERMFFCVTGYLHPPDRITAYLKYSPAPEGKWKKKYVYYRRELPHYHMNAISSTISYLKSYYPQYVGFCPVRNIEMSMVPKSFIKRYYLPENRMQQILHNPSDPLEKAVHAFTHDLLNHGSLHSTDLGITGSILIGLHNPQFSDIDLIVYGKEKSLEVKTVLKTIPAVRGLENAKREEWISHKINIFHLTPKEAQIFAERKWNYGFYDSTYFSIHPTRTDAEIHEIYGKVTYADKGIIRLRARVTDSSESLFLPAQYSLEILEILEGESVPVTHLVSYEGLYCDVFLEGDIIDVRGRLEKVNGSYRVVVGTLSVGNQYIHLIQTGDLSSEP
ncbi:MAG: nucleotidyltransferase domain-containing protein [Theionarchaea archaeon]|nr:nucleotidyltransferase domain-containing protein [Theionarchaea archaeon]